MVKNRTKVIKVIDLFSGCGGLSEGLLQVGCTKSAEELLPIGLLPDAPFRSNIPEGAYQILAHVEWELPMVRTLRANLEHRWGEPEAKAHVFHFDIMESEALISGCPEDSSLRKRFADNDPRVLDRGLDALIGVSDPTQRAGAVDLIVGGPPCQAFSMAGRAQDKDGMRNDYRNYLFEKFAAVVGAYRPKLFVFENVEGLLTAKPGGRAASERIYEHFLKMGYLIYEPVKLKRTLFNLAEFGVPQARKRLIIVGIQIDSDLERSSQILDSIYSALRSTCRYINYPLFNQKPFNTFKQALSDLGKPVEPHPELKPHLIHHHERYHNDDDKQRFKEWIEKGYDTKTNREKLAFYNDRFNKKSKHIKYRSLAWDAPSPTIVAHLAKDGLMFIHPDADQQRSITAREAALLQTFPPTYIFPEAMTTTYKMIGNAVPPLFARRLGEVLYDYL